MTVNLHLRAVVVGLIASLAFPMMSCSAEDFHSGTWRVVEPRTWWSNDALPKCFSLVLILRFSNSRFVYRSINDTEKSQPPQEFEFATTLDGAVQPVPDRKAGDFDQISFQKISPIDYRLLRWLKGELVAVQFWTFSLNDKELVRRGATKTIEGSWHAYEEWFVRQ